MKNKSKNKKTDMKKYQQAKDSIKIIVCDECKHEFEADSVKIKKYHIQTEEVLSVASFNCPECDKEYLVSVNNEQTESLIEELSVLSDSLGKEKNEIIYKVKYEKRNRLVKRIIQEQNALKKVVDRLRQ
jgi:transcription elongation factor Elf1